MSKKPIKINENHVIKFKALKSMALLDDKFNRWVDDEFGLEPLEIDYIVISSIGEHINGLEKCEIIGLTYNSRPHQRYKADDDKGTHDHLKYFLKQKLTEMDKEEEEIEDGLTDLDRLEKIIRSDVRVADKLKSMELKQKIKDREEGSHALKPWERLWNDVIIPNMLPAQDL